ncbi:MAG: DUF4388 domain-containing protein [Candidatus Sumerlaeaceae bacterium]|nr:DUF4388 domain-containing protein [Candidatus Sumerlaeaceae bacterium]
MELEGKLNPTLSLPEILQFLSMGKLTGTLTVHHGNYSVRLYLRRGKIVNSSSLGRPRKLGQMLVNQGLVPRQEVEEALRYQRSLPNPPPLGQILIERGLLTRDQLRQAIRLQLEEEMWDLFSLQEGVFKFDYGDEDSVGEVLVELDIEPLIIEGTRRLDEWVRIVRNVPGDSAIPVLRPLVVEDAREEMQLSDSEWKILSLINGTANVGSIVARSGIGKFETYRILNSFLAAGYITIRMPDEQEIIPETQLPMDLDAIVPQDDPDLDRMEATGSTSARILAMFVRRKAAEESGQAPPSKREPAPLMEFPTPVEFVAELVNQLTAALCDEAEFYRGERDNNLIERMWRSVLMAFPKADLIQAAGNKLNPSQFTRFAAVVGTKGPFEGIMADTLEALARLLKLLFVTAAERMGSRSARKFFSEFCKDFRQRATIRDSGDFYFQEYAEKIYA